MPRGAGAARTSAARCAAAPDPRRAPVPRESTSCSTCEPSSAPRAQPIFVSTTKGSGAAGSAMPTSAGAGPRRQSRSTTVTVAGRWRCSSSSTRAPHATSCWCSTRAPILSRRPTPNTPGRRPRTAWRDGVPRARVRGRAARRAPLLRRAEGADQRRRRDGRGGDDVAARARSARAATTTTATSGFATSACAGQAVAKAGPHPLMDDAVRFVSERLLDDGPELVPAYTTTGGRGSGSAQPRPSRLPGRHRRRRQLGQPAVPARRVRRVAAAVRGRRRSRPSRRRRMARRRGRGRGDRAALARARRRHLGDRARQLDSQPADLRRRAASDRRRTSRRASGRVAGARGRDRRRDVGHARSTRTGRWQRSPTTTASTPRCCCPRSTAPSRQTTRARWRPCTRSSASWPMTATATAIAPMPGRWARPKARSCCAASCSRWPGTSRATTVRAGHWFERNRAACGPPGLISEEFDVAQRQLRGNLPQAFVHAALLQCAMTLHGDGRS